MEFFKAEMGKMFSLENFKKSFLLTWLFVAIGIFLLSISNIIATLMPKKSYFSYFFHDFGIFWMLTMILMAFTGVYRVTNFKNDNDSILRKSIKAVAVRSHYIMGISFLTLVFLLVIVLVEVGFSSVSHIPYVGPSIVAVLTVPIFLLNLLCVLVTICIFAVIPPAVGEAQNIKDILNELKYIIKSRGLNVFIYMGVSLAILSVSMLIFFYIFKFSVGVTKAVQWKINAVYPNVVIKKLTMPSFLTDLVYRISPGPEPASSFKNIGFDAFNYFDFLKLLLSISYLIIVSFIASFPLAAYFNFSSSFFRRILKMR